MESLGRFVSMMDLERTLERALERLGQDEFLYKRGEGGHNFSLFTHQVDRATELVQGSRTPRKIAEDSLLHEAIRAIFEMKQSSGGEVFFREDGPGGKPCIVVVYGEPEDEKTRRLAG